MKASAMPGVRSRGPAGSVSGRTLAVLILLIHSPALPAQQSGLVLPAAAPDSICTVHEVSRRPLFVQDTLEMYVPPKTFVAGATGELLLAGFPNYLFARQSAGPARLVAESGFLGVVLDSAGSARTIPAPMDPRLMGEVRAVARAEGGWEILFTQFALPDAAGRRTAGNDSVARLWSGVFDGHAWSPLTEIRIPPEVRLSPWDVSAAVRQGDRLAWAVSGYSQSNYPVLVVLERTGGSWSSRVLPTGARGYPRVAYPDTGDLVLAGVGGDPTTSQDDVNSLFLWAPVSAAAPRRIIDSGGERLVHDPQLVRWNDRIVLTWTVQTAADRQVWATTDALTFPASGSAMIDATPMTTHNVAPLAPPGGSFLWVTAHRAPGGHAPSIQFRVRSREGGWGVARFPSPFAAGLGAAATPDGQVVVTGGESDEAAVMVRSLLIRVQMHCGLDSPGAAAVEGPPHPEARGGQG